MFVNRKKLIDCAGHFGYVQLELPVFHAGYFKHTLTILQCICKQCSRLLLPLEDRPSCLKKMKNPNLDALSRGNIFKKIVALCKRNTVCPYCFYSNGVVKKMTGCVFKIIHEKFRAKNVAFSNGTEETSVNILEDGENSKTTPTASHQLQKQQLRDIITEYPDLKPYLTKSQEVLNPIKCYDLLQKITAEDMLLLWMDNLYGNTPDTLVVWNVPVPPVPIRPSVPMDSGDGSTEDDITMKLQEIIDVNNALKVALNNGGTMKMVVEDWEFLQIQCAQLINGETPGIPRQLLGPKPIRGICQRLKGKQGRFRGNLSGKRVDFSARTVISPDPNLAVEEVGVPVLVAMIMTYPERVNQYNIQRLRQCIRNGPNKHPGANLIRTANGFVKSLTYADREKSAKFLKIGDIVERHMHNGDVVLFNRQPSLHKMSIMSHVARIMPWKTFRFNECCCTPYNADFDGDEMNLHFPQTDEARAEASELLNVRNNLVTPRNGEPLVAATQDFLTAAYLITQKDVFFSRQEFCKLIAFLADANEMVDMPLPAIFKPVPLWTGKQVFSLLVNPTKNSKALVNVETKEKFYTCDEHFCAQDGYVSFHMGELVCGNLGKKTLGDSSKTSLFFVLIRDYGAAEATRCMSRLAKLTARYMCERGFSIGIEDVTPTSSMLALKSRIMTSGQKEANDLIRAYEKGTNKLKPGCNALQSLESEVNGILGRIREKCGQEAMNTLHHRNAPLSMAQCGSKGSPLNISQMISCLGQQSVGGSRIQDGFVNRTLPHFPAGSLLPDAKGFVVNSFYSGLTATEFFFHTMGGREGLVDTAVKTAETGYMARRLMKALEDLSMQYDMTVRNSEQVVVQFSYGDDGLNPSVMENGDRPVDYKRLCINVCETTLCESEVALTSMEIVKLVKAQVETEGFQKLLPQGQQFITETLEFFRKFADNQCKLEGLELVGLDLDQAPVEIEKLTSSQIRAKLLAMTPKEFKLWQAEGMSKVGSQAHSEVHTLLRENVMRLTHTQLMTILAAALKTYNESFIEPGEAVGAVGAQSLSEPGTQMTLKTFHFAGVASMNVTLGVPRLKEIINASKVISTPIIEAKLVQSDSVTSARIVKANIEKTSLGEICSYVCEVYSGQESYIAVKLDMSCIEELHLNVNGHTVRNAILNGTSFNSGGGFGSNVALPKSPILRLLKSKHISVYGRKNEYMKIYAPELKETVGAFSVDVTNGGSGANGGLASNKGNAIATSQRIYFSLQALKLALPLVIVQGIPAVSRAIINEAEVAVAAGKKSYYLLVEGYGLADVMGAPGVDGTETKSNHILEMQSVLGIEASRNMISDEIRYIMKAYGITVDRRHLLLLSDVMTFKGEVLGITRFGVAKMRESVLMLASFEKTTDHLFDAAVHYRTDTIVGVSECIIMGIPIPLGTGLFKLMIQNKVENDKEGKCNTSTKNQAASQIRRQICNSMRRTRLLEML